MTERGRTRIFALACQLPWLLFVLPVLAIAADGGFDEGLLFRVEPSAGGAPSYLFGTIHSDDPRVVDVPPLVRARLDRSRVLALEVVPDARAIEVSVAALKFDDGRALSDLVPADLYRDSIDALGARGVPEVAVRRFKPWAVMTLLSMPEAESGQFLDLVLYRHAIAAGMPVVGLETMQEQVSVFEGLGAADQVTLLRQTLGALSNLPALFESLIAAYERRDLVLLIELSDDYLDGGETSVAERFRDALIDARNARMAQRIVPMAAEGGFFIAVGALHLPGPGGLLKRLTASGFEIKRVY
ncbi:MAG: TraB/GumN family protein [Thiohalocapsa sp.]